MNSINSDIHSVSAFAPATCANVAIGYDILGFAFAEVGDHVTLTKRDDNKIVIESIQANEDIPMDASKNTASIVIQKACQQLNLDMGFTIDIQKGIPLSSGMGGSAASAVAALIALNKFLDVPLTSHELAQFALYGEELASGHKHADNIVPCLFGGLTLIHSHHPIEVIALPLPEIVCVLVHPHLQVSTKLARNILKKNLPLKDYVKQSGNLAAFIASLYENDISMLQKTLNDILIEPQRAQFVPDFYKIKQAALDKGAMAVSFSGSGPAIFAFAKNITEANEIAEVMQDQLKINNVNSDCWISSISKNPAYVKSWR